MLDLLEAGSANLLSEIKSCGRWSDMVVVILLEIVFEMGLLINCPEGFWNDDWFNSMWKVGVGGK